VGAETLTRRLAVVVGLAVVAGCAGHAAPERPGRAEAGRARDAEACRRANAVPRVSRPLVFSDGRLVSYPFESVDPRGYDLCMQGRRPVTSD
jgi:hypothetical protein